MEFALNYSLVQTRPVMDYTAGGDSNDLPNINEFPILNQAQAKKKFQATFDRDCGDDDICQADIQLSPKLTDKVKMGKYPSQLNFVFKSFAHKITVLLFRILKSYPGLPEASFTSSSLGP